MRVQLDAAQVDDPGEPRRIVDDDLFGGAARGKRERHRSQPGGPLGGRALLIERLPFGAVNESLENDRPIANSGERARRDRQVVADRSSFESFVCFEKYSLSGCVTRTSRPSIESTSAASSFLTKTGYTMLGNRSLRSRVLVQHQPSPHAFDQFVQFLCLDRLR